MWSEVSENLNTSRQYIQPILFSGKIPIKNAEWELSSECHEGDSILNLNIMHVQYVIIGIIEQIFNNLLLRSS